MITRRQRPFRRLRDTLKVGALSLTAALLVLGVARQLAAQQPAAAKPASGGSRSLDQELLEDLDNELLDGTNKKLPAEKPQQPTPKNGATSHGEDGDKVQKPASADSPAGDKSGAEAPGGNPVPGGAASDDPEAMGEDIGESSEDPLTRIGREMRVVERLIAEKDAAEKAAESAKVGGGKTGNDKAGKLQEQIVEQLAKLIEKMEQQQQQQQQSGAKSGKKGQQALAGRQRVNQPKPADRLANQQAGAKNNQPARDSSERLGKHETQRPDMGQIKGLMKDVWGQLPAHAREQMLQTSPEQFLPRYELQIEKYYKRLAEQQKETH